MNKMKHIFSMGTLALMSAVMTGCSSDDNLDTSKMVGEGNVVTQTITVSLDGKAATRALTDGGVKTFAENDQIAVVYTNTSDATVKAVSTALTATDITDEGKTATFTVTLTDPKASTEVTYIYPAAMAKADGTVNYAALATQDGTLTSLAANLDLAIGTGTLSTTGALPTTSVSMTNPLAILALTLKDNAATPTEITSSITGLTVSDGANTYSVTRAAAAGPIYVVINPTSSATIDINATDGTTNYYKELTSKTYAASNGYPLSLTMAQGAHLAALTANYTAQNGDVLTGTLAGNYKISIADGAIVTLDGVTINGTNDYSYSWAGLNLVGDATIILKGENTVKGFNQDWPGIYVPEGKTVTIRGDGSLNASSNGYGAGIGGGYYIACGNIRIEGGTITATGDHNAAGIGGGVKSDCGTITITDGVTKVTAIKGSWAKYSIGAGYNGYCEGVTIGGVVGAITKSPYIYPVPWDGDLAKLTAESTAEFTTAPDGMTITGTLSANVKISIADGATVTLDGVTINGTNDYSYSWAGLNLVGDATIILKGENTVKGFYENYPGIHVLSNKTVTIQGDGSLTASSNGFGAGIGGGAFISCGNIRIEGGTITANGGTKAAGIGGGLYASCGDITITSGVTKVTATKGNDTPYSIGAGLNGTVGTVTIGDETGPISTSPYIYPTAP